MCSIFIFQTFWITESEVGELKRKLAILVQSKNRTRHWETPVAFSSPQIPTPVQEIPGRGCTKENTRKKKAPRNAPTAMAAVTCSQKKVEC